MMNHTPPCAFGWATFGVALVISLLLWGLLLFLVLACWWWLP